MIRVRRWAAAAACGAALTATACNGWTPGGGAGEPAPAAPAQAAPVDIGAPLYKPDPMPQPPQVVVGNEPIVIPNAVVQGSDRVQVSAQVDGLIDLIATPLPPGAPVDPADPTIVYHPRDAGKRPYRRLREGDLVKYDQDLCRLDEQLVNLTYLATQDLIEKTLKQRKSANDAYESFNKTLLAMQGVRGISEYERSQTESSVARYLQNVAETDVSLAKLQGELLTARAKLGQHWVKSPRTGRVVRLLKSAQEFAKAGEPILEIQVTDRVRIEGKVDRQYADRIPPRTKAVVEPARPVGPSPLSASHRLEVTGVAVTAHKGGRPLIVSAGRDNAAQVWDPFGTKVVHRLPHPAPVTAVACTGPAAKGHLAATGADDGRVRLWDVGNPDRVARDPVGVFDESHGSAVTAVGFSPDGRYLATAAGRDVAVWDVAARKRKYALPVEHRDAVTMVRFTPQGTLVTAARDRSLRVWKVGDAGAARLAVVDHRNGGVDVLGVSADGAKVLFDKDPSRVDLLSLADERPVGSLQSPGAGARFATLAVFSADDAYVLTAGGEADQRGELTVWEAPQPGGRGAERRRLVTRGGSPVTCVAFSVDPDRRIVAAGTQDGAVHFWPVPAPGERGGQLLGEVTFVQSADARQATVRIELANPADEWGGEGLKERSLATVIIPDVPAAPQPLPGGPGAAAPPPAGVMPASAVGPGAGRVVPAGGPLPPAAAPPAGLPAVPAPPGGLAIPAAPAPTAPPKR